MILREKISELETCYQARDTRKYWNKLKEVGGKEEERKRKDTRNRGG